MGLNAKIKSFWSDSSVTVKLITINVAVFVLSIISYKIFIYSNPVGSERVIDGFLAEYLYAHSNWKSQLIHFWTIFTYQFSHDLKGISHILFNMIILFFMGRIYEMSFGGKKIISLYIFGGVFGVLFFILGDLAGMLRNTSPFLIGDRENKYVEYPIFRLPGYDYGLSFNNSRALSLTFWNNFNQHNYMWIKRYDSQWSWVTAVFDNDKKTSHFYLNGTEVDSKAGHGSPSPHSWIGKLKHYGLTDIYLGHTPTFPDKYHGFFKGDIAKTYAWKRALTPQEVKNLHKELPQEELVLDLDFNNPKTDFQQSDITYGAEEVMIPNSIVPHRVEGRFRCLPHKDEGLVNGKWAKGDTTAANEKRFVLKMQQGKINYKEDGIKQVEYKLIGEEKLTPWAKMINIEL